MANNELNMALNLLEAEKGISRDVMFDAIEASLQVAVHEHYGKDAVAEVVMDRETADYKIYLVKTVVEEVFDPAIEITLADARVLNEDAQMDDEIRVEVQSKEFSRIAASNAKGTIVQKIREEERHSLYEDYKGFEKKVVTGIVQRFVGRNVCINLGKADAFLTEAEQIKGERFMPNERVKVYVLEVSESAKGPKIHVSRTHPELVRNLFYEEVSEVRDGTVEIKAIAREAGSRTKMAVWSNVENVDPVGACVGVNGSRVNAVVDELRNEKIDIITWSENPAELIENALSPAKVVSVLADSDEKTARVVVPDDKLSLAIGKEGQNARLAARLTGYKIDIKSETQAAEAGDFMDMDQEFFDEEEFESEDGEFIEVEVGEDEEFEFEEDFDGEIEIIEEAFEEEGSDE